MRLATMLAATSLAAAFMAATAADPAGAQAVHPESVPEGTVYAFGGAPAVGPSPNVTVAARTVGIAATADGGGYWLAASDGGVFGFGDGRFYGSAGGAPLAQPVVGIAPTPDGHGYWLAASDGGVFSYGDAHFYGSAGGAPLTQPVVGIARSPDGHGYWLVTGGGQVLPLGAAPNYGSAPSRVPAGGATPPVVGMAATTNGYWVVRRGFYSSPFTPRLTAYLHTLPEITTAAVEDLNTGMIYTYDPGPSLVLGSTVKVQILGTLLAEAQAARRPLTAAERTLATAMIEVSDNSAAAALFGMIGGAPAVQAWDDSIGLTGSFVYPGWGSSTSTATDEIALLRVFEAPNRFLTEPYRTFGLYLLGHVELSQIFGVNTGPPQSGVLAAKTGRIPGLGVSNAIGWVKARGRSYLVAVLTQYGTSDQIDEAAEDAVCYQAWFTLGP